MSRHALTATLGVLLTTLLVFPALILASADSASADPICLKIDPATGKCILYAGGGPGGGGPTGGGPTGGGPTGGGPTGGGPAAACIDHAYETPPVEVPCSRDSLRYPGTPVVWSNGRQCYIGRVTPPPPFNDPAWEGHTDGAIYFCEPPVIVGRGIQVIFFWAAAAPIAGSPPDPRELAQQAIAEMDLKAVQIGIVPDPKPGSIGLVGLPVWMWTAPTEQTWGPITRTASAGGVTVSATARVKSVAWSMGDGSSVTCGSPGTPYNDSFGKIDSPTCGYRYSRTSLGQPGDAYAVAATSYWEVTWAGGGENGVINIDFTANTQIRIGELQVLVTN